MMDNKKKCNKCKEWKSRDEFHKASKYKDGLNYTCKVCINELANTPERKLQRWTYRQTRRGKETQLNGANRYQAKHADRVKANRAVNNAIIQGVVYPPHEKQCKADGCLKRAEDWHHWKGYEIENWFKIHAYCKVHHSMVTRGVLSNEQTSAQRKGL